MNTNLLKKFAQAARTKLIEQVSAKWNYVLTHDTSEFRGKADTIARLKDEIMKHGQDAVIEKVAYTWFNRLMALRFMDVNGYQPIGISVISPTELANSVSPQLLSEAHAGNIPAELKVNKQAILDILDGRQASNNPDNDVYRLLLVAACNHLSTIFPFLFERIEDYTELLLPDDLTSPFSIIADIVNGMSNEDCGEVEVIGWLYQFYISEKNDELISSKKVYKKDELAPASQLFTPKWIVKYMVDNTLGQIWSEIKPNTTILSELEFYIKPAYIDQLEKRNPKSIEEIKFFDPCTGSGHILSYAFDVFYKIYEEQGYNPNEIPELIITKNLYGVDIDQRASQLASFVLLMKGREKHRRFLRTVETKNLKPNVYYYQDFESDNKFKNATALGSLIKVDPLEYQNFKVEENSLFTEKQTELRSLYQLLGQRYDLVVTNPPYISSSRMEGSLKQFVEANYPETKSDLFATFILRCLDLCNENGLTGYMTPFVWMFIATYEKLREIIIDKHFINNLIQLEYSGFDGATVPICTFTLRKKQIEVGRGSYIRLSDFRGSQIQAPKALEAIQNNSCGWFYTTNQKHFIKIPGSPIGYWLNENWVKIFEKETVNTRAISDGQNITGNNDKYLRQCWEISRSEISINGKWPLIAKGGEFRRWSGNINFVINWSKQARNEYSSNPVARIQNDRLWFRIGITWNLVTSSGTGFRILKEDQLFNKAAPTLLFDSKDEIYIKSLIGFLNTKITTETLKLLNPTLNTNIKEILILPFLYKVYPQIDLIVDDCILISDKDWNRQEFSDLFSVNGLIRIKGQDLEESYDLYQQYWKNKFFQLHRNEEELNRQFIEIYGLEDELTPDVPLKEITILKQETSIENGELVFHADEVFQQFVSYAVGCMFGRYSLEKEGLILANQGETVEDYLQKIAAPQPPEGGARQVSFIPDSDNIIPILDDEWFEDDIVSRFHSFLKASFGEKNFNKNRAFVEDCLGKDVRKYFTKDFYKDHVQRYKKRPIYWMFSSPKGYFNVLVYLHRYTPDTINRILNSYLKEFIEKLTQHRKQQEHIVVVGSAIEQNKAQKEIDKIDEMLRDCRQYEIDILYPLATERIALDLDDGVLVNYNKLGNAVALVDGLNDKKTKNKVREFDWIDVTQIR